MHARVLGSLVVAALAVAACTGGASGDEAAPPAPTVLRVGLVDVGSLDPASAAEPDAVLVADLLYDTLVDLDAETGEPVPALAEEWSANDDLTEFTFVLRDDVAFDDGSPITAADVVTTIDRVVDPTTGSALALSLDAVRGYDERRSGEADALAGVTAVDERTVQIALNRPDASLPEVLAHPALGIVPSDFAGPGEEEQPVSSGPFRLERRDADTGVIELSKVDGHPSGEARVDAVEAQTYADDEAAAALSDGDVDLAVVPADSHGVGSQQVSTPSPAEILLAVNVRGTTFDEPAFREAIARGVDRGAAVAAASDQGVRAATGLIPMGVPGAAENACAGICSLDEAAARELLASAFGEDDVPAVALDYFEAPMNEALAGQLAEQLTALGIPVEPRAHAREDFIEFLAAGDADLFLLGWVADVATPSEFLDPLFRTMSGENVIGLEDTAVDGVLDDAAAMSDSAERAARYRDAERMILEHHVAVPLVQFERQMAASSAVRGLTVDPLGAIDATRIDVVR